MPRKLRTFLAVELSPGVRKRAAQLIEHLDHAAAPIRWVAERDTHLTLNFLGDVPELEIPQVCREVTHAAGAFAEFSASFVGAGAFPRPDRPRVIWLGVDTGAAELMALHDALDTRLESLGFAREARRFKPHVTLGRARGEGSQLADLAELLARHYTFAAGAMTVDEVVVFSSQLRSDGPEYTVLARAPLG